MRVLVIGGMGIIGSAITEAACKSGLETYVLSRRPLSPYFKEWGAKGIQGDWKNDEFVSELLKKKYDVIVDTLIFNKFELERDLKLINGNCTQFILISTDAVYNHPGYDVSEESNIEKFQLKWDYGIKKREAELKLLNLEFKSHWTVVRPTMTFGNTRMPVGFGSRKNEWTLIKRIQEGKPIIDFDNDCLHAMCHSTTFGDAITRLFLNEHAYEDFFHISDNKAVRYCDIYNRIGLFFNTAPVIIKCSPDFLKILSPAKYNEIIYDKNPEFTLNNNKIRSIAPDVSFDINLDVAISSAIEYLGYYNSSLQEDTDFNLLTDAILLSYKKLQLTEAQEMQVKEYISKMSQQYISKIRKFKLTQEIKGVIRPMYRMVKH